MLPRELNLLDEIIRKNVNELAVAVGIELGQVKELGVIKVVGRRVVGDGELEVQGYIIKLSVPCSGNWGFAGDLLPFLPVWRQS